MKLPLRSIPLGLILAYGAVFITGIMFFSRRSSSHLEPIPPNVTTTSSFLLNKLPIKAPSQSLVDTKSFDGKLQLVMDPFASDCPTPNLALIGILTIPSLVANRHLLREKYRQLQASLPPDQQIHFKFVYGSPKDWTSENELAMEQMLFPDDTVILPGEENMNNGKTYEWFIHARSILYVRHPTKRSLYCPRYKYVGKADDDAVIHLPRLAHTLSTLTPSHSRYIGRAYTGNPPVYQMTGMLYLLSIDLVEWIHFSPIPVRHKDGHEDLQLSSWFLTAKLDVTRAEQGELFTDLPESPNFSKGAITDKTIVVHYCKDAPRMFRCMKELFGVPKDIEGRFETEASRKRQAAHDEKSRKGT